MLKVAILDDYQNVAQDFVDLKKLSGKYEIEIFYGGEKGDKISIGKPIIYHGENVKKQMFPNEARLKNLTYATSIYCSLYIKFIITSPTFKGKKIFYSNLGDSKLVTNQTGPQGKIVNRIYIEEATDIEKE